MNTQRILRLVSGLVVLLPVCALAYYVAFSLRFGGSIDGPTTKLLLSTLGPVLIVKTVAIVQARLH